MVSNTDQINHVRQVMSDPEAVLLSDGLQKTNTPDRPRTSARENVSDSDALTEDDVALLFSQRYGQAARYDHDLGRWALWDDITRRWQWDCHQTASHWCRELSREASQGTAPKVLERVRKRSFHSGVEAMCRADPRHAVNHDVWDADDMLLGCPGVTIDLRTGKGRPPRPDDMISRLTAVAPDPSMRTPKWDAFIDAVTQDDDSLARFLQAFAGYTLTGSVKEHGMLFFHGDGGNGKSLLLNTIVGIMGEYAQVASMDTFASSRFERHSTDLAAMRGARLVAVSEVAAGVGWNQQRLTQMTGGDKVRARFMRQDEFEYAPKFKLWVVGNHKPELGNVTDAMRRRMNIIPDVAPGS